MTLFARFPSRPATLVTPCRTDSRTSSRSGAWGRGRGRDWGDPTMTNCTHCLGAVLPAAPSTVPLLLHGIYPTLLVLLISSLGITIQYSLYYTEHIKIIFQIRRGGFTHTSSNLYLWQFILPSEDFYKMATIEKRTSTRWPQQKRCKKEKRKEETTHPDNTDAWNKYLTAITNKFLMDN